MADAGPALDVRALGELAVYVRGRQVELPASRKTRALLAYLALTGRPHLRATLCELLWSGPDDPRAALRWSLSKLRSAVGEAGSAFAATRDHLGIDTGRMTLDLADVRAVHASLGGRSISELEAAARRFRGELLEGLDWSDSYRFHEWCLGEREAARRIRTAILAELVNKLRDRPEAALEHARARVAIDPLDESGHADLVRLLVDVGDRVQADAHIEACTRLFERELGRAPSALLRGARARTPRAVPASHAHAASAASPAVRTEHELVGRERERATITRLVEDAAGGASPPYLVFVGEPGVGKTRLLDEVAKSIARQGGRLLRGRAHESERARPYGAFADALRGAPVDEIHGRHRAALAALVPGLGRAMERVSDRAELFDALASAFAAPSDAPVTAVLLDDLQWFDEASVALLHHLVSEPRPRLVVAGTVRRAELGDNLPAVRMLRGLTRGGRVNEVEVGPLSPDETVELARSVGRGFDVSRVFADGAGNPLFTLEIARALARGATPLSDTLAGLIDDRLERITGPAAEILPWAAALGRSFDLDLIARASGVAAVTLVGAIAALEEHGIVRESIAAHDYDFAHDLLRDRAYRRLSEPRRRLIHRAIAGALGDHLTDGALAADIAHHAALGGDRALSARACLSAAEHSHRVFANDDAARLALRGVESAAGLPDPDRLELEAALYRVCAMSGRFHGRDADLEARVSRVIAQARAIGLSSIAARGFGVLSMLQHDRGDYDRARESTLSAAEVGSAADSVTRARQAVDTARCLAHLGREMARAEALLVEALALGVDASLEVAKTESAKGLLACWKGDAAGGEAALERAFQAACAEKDHWLACDVGLRLAMSALDHGGYERARALSVEVLGLSERLGEGGEGPSARAITALARLGAGVAREGGELGAAVDSLRRVDAKGMLAYTLTVASELAAVRRELDHAQALAREAAHLAALVDRTDTVVRARVVLGLLASARGDRSTAEAELGEIATLIVEPLAVSARTAERVAELSRAVGGGR